MTATFFVTGDKLNSNESIRTVKRILAENHVLASHMWSHKLLKKLSDSQIRHEMNVTSDRIFEVTGIRPRYMRPPYGYYDKRVENILGSMGYKVFLWSLPTKDWLFKDRPDKILNTIVGELNKPRFSARHISLIILQHDNLKQTRDVQDGLVRLLMNRNFTFVSLWECIGDAYVDTMTYSQDIDIQLNSFTTKYKSRALTVNALYLYLVCLVDFLLAIMLLKNIKHVATCKLIFARYR